MALKDKAAKIDLSHIGLSSGSRGQGSKTAIGMHADALFRDEKVSAENVELRKQGLLSSMVLHRPVILIQRR